MIECFLSEHAYYFSNNYKQHTYFHAKEDDELWSIYSEYQRNYLMLLELLKVLKNEGIKNIIVYHDSRIIEEIQRKIDPLNKWGRGALLYIHRNLLPYFVNYTFRKQSKENIMNKIYEGKRELSSYRGNKNTEQIITDIMSKRIQKFKRSSHGAKD